ncbi:MAG: hypothetical protein KAW12_29760 [Candidatus Aminicenantes bacterium]|nr:hypothetical protein [Candidatus Aminicenantes bacterium]
MSKKNNENSRYTEKKSRGGRYVGLKIFSGIVSVALIAATIHIQGVKNVHKKELVKISLQFQDLNEQVSQIENTKKKRSDFFKNKFLIDYPPRYSFAVSDFTRRLSLTAPGGMKFDSMEIRPGPRNFTFSLSGRVKPAESGKMNRLFFEFYRELESFDNLMHVVPSKKEVDAAGRGLFFSIDGEVEVE